MAEISFGRSTSVLYRYTQIILNHELHPYGLGSGQYLFLIGIAKHDGINQKDLTDFLNVDKATTAKALNKLEELEYICRQKDEHDKRNYNLHLTQKGTDFFPILSDILRNLTKTLSDGMSESEMEQAYLLMEKMIQNAVNTVDIIKEHEKHENTVKSQIIHKAKKE